MDPPAICLVLVRSFFSGPAWLYFSPLFVVVCILSEEFRSSGAPGYDLDTKVSSGAGVSSLTK